MVTVMGTVALDTVGRAARLPDADGATRVEGLRHVLGGTAANVAVGLARLGVTPRLLGCVGDDDFAASGYEARLRDLGVDLADLRRAPGPTAHAYQFTDDLGRQHIYFFPGGSEDLADLPVRSARLAHFAAGAFPHYAPHMEAAEEATLDPGQELFHRPFEDIEPVLPLADVVFVNQHERAVLEERGWSVGRLLEGRTRLVVETRSRDPQVLHHREGRVTVPVAPAEPVEPTGAGDAHRTGFLFGRFHGVDDETAARLGSVVAAFAIEGHGPQENLPDADALRKRYETAFGAWLL